MIEAVSVVVPAHDEQELIPACLAALLKAAAHPALERISVRIAVVLDRCSDDTGELAAKGLRRRDLIVERHDGNVGAARRAGFVDALAAEAGRDPAAIWLATTDADSSVPEDWLARQLALADTGADAIAGTIGVEDWHDQPSRVRALFASRYARKPGEVGHRHVHGANLGVRASIYQQVDGIESRQLAEDHALIEAVEQIPATIVRPRTLRVITSARRESRASGGFSDYLRRL